MATVAGGVVFVGVVLALADASGGEVPTGVAGGADAAVEACSA